ncbi:hypothetical protein HPB48_019621 [Haemaphysalis longicornis]|uniref:Prominin-like protein n=1 Tax=Haemaphysalis longicornis TaxID=44386 RepID=A0A9J6FGW2_HAELO|nr:hypothetical protein HPB48_019621 [Haemaphysalis longicornis]
MTGFKMLLVAFLAASLLAAPATSQAATDNDNAGCLGPVEINFTSVDPSGYSFQSVQPPEASGMDHLYSIVTHFATLVVAEPGVPAGGYHFLHGTGILFSLVCAFVTNAYVPAAVMSLPDNLGNSAHDTLLVVNKTKDEVDNLLVKNYGQFKSHFVQRLNDVENLTAEVNKIDASARLAKEAVKNVSDAISNIKKHIDEAVKKCNRQGATKETCNQIDDQKKKVDVELPDLDKKLGAIEKAKKDLESLNIDDLKNKINEALDTEKRKKDVMDRIKTVSDKIVTKLDEVGATLQTNSEKLDLNNITKPGQLDTTSIRNTFQEAAPYIGYYGYATLAIACILAAILVFYVLGLLWGGCGSREGSCHRKTGGSCLTTGAVLFILAFFIPMLLSTVLLFAGIAGQRGACDVARNPSVAWASRSWLPPSAPVSEDALGEILDRFGQCRNRSYSLFHLLGREVLKNLTHQAASTDWLWGDGDVGININDGAQEFEQAIDGVNVENIVPQDLKDKLAELSKAKVNRRDLEDLKAEINKTHLKFNLQETLRKIDEFKSDPKVQDVKPDLESVTKELKDLERFVKVIEEQKEVLLPSLDKVEGLLMIGDKDLHAYALQLVENATRQLQQDVRQLNETARKYKDKFLQLVNYFANHTRKQVQENVGDCKDLYVVYSAAVGSVCDKILLPLNGYWFSVAAFLVVGIPAVIFALCLASLYARVDPASLYLDPLSPVDSVNHKRRHTGSNSAVVASYSESRDGYYHDISPEYRDHPVAPHHRPLTSPAIAYAPAPAYHYSRDPGHCGKTHDSARHSTGSGLGGPVCQATPVLLLPELMSLVSVCARESRTLESRAHELCAHEPRAHKCSCEATTH